MALTPEERQRIYEEEKVRLEVQAQLRDEEKQRAIEKTREASKDVKEPLDGGASCVVIFLVFLVLSVIAGVLSPSQDPAYGPHDGKTQEQVDKDLRDIRTLQEAAKRLKNDPQFRREADREALRSIQEGSK